MNRTAVPVAVVGTGLVLPGALDAATLWSNVVAGRSAIGPAPAGRWRIRPETGLGPVDAWDADRSWTDLGGYVDGFERVFRPDGFRLDASFLASLDPLSHWLVHCGREALRACGRSPESDNRRVGAVVGNLSFPSSGMSLHAESVWRTLAASAHGDGRFVGDGPAAQPFDRFMSGLPAQVLGAALGLGAGAYALDAACASGLYAIRLACDRLADGSADLMLAGAVNRADDLFIHVGFCSLGAISRAGHSRPFDRSADGLIPAEGAALVALKRLDDALRDGDRILGVIRGIGLSNDGRGKSLLAPAQEGQARAMRSAYQMAGLDPTGVSLIECHATGTPVGDATELASLREVFGDGPPVPVGSLKSNLGHLITSAGVAGLIKVLGALEHRIRPPTLGVTDPIPSLVESRFRALQSAEAWEPQTPGTPLRASVSAFGFGGNNAHLLVEEAPTGPPAPAHPIPGARTARIAVVGVGAAASRAMSAGALAAAWRERTSLIHTGSKGTPSGAMETIEVGVEGLRFPPRDLEQALPQQILALRIILEAVQVLPAFDRERCLLAVGIGADTNVARYGARWRVADWFRDLFPGSAEANAWSDSARDAIIPRLDAAGVVGTMPNIPANRLNRQLDAAKSGFTVSAEQVSGLVAIDIAVRSLRMGETDLAIAAAVDLCCNEAHQDAVRRCLPAALHTPGDAGIAFALMRLDDAEHAGLPVYAVIDDVRLDDATADATLAHVPEYGDAATPLVGHTHAASGALLAALALFDLAEGRADSHVVSITSWMGAGATLRMRRHAGAAAPPLEGMTPGGIRPGARTLRFAAHAPEPLLPPLPAAAKNLRPRPPESAAMRAPSLLPPAPTLPSALHPTNTLGAPPADFTVAIATSELDDTTMHVEVISASPTSAAPMTHAVSGGWPGSTVDAHPTNNATLDTSSTNGGGWFAPLAQAHRAHIDAMHAAHTSWQAMHQRMTFAMLGQLVGGDAASGLPAAPAYLAPAEPTHAASAALPAAAPAYVPPAPVQAPAPTPSAPAVPAAARRNAPNAAPVAPAAAAPASSRSIAAPQGGVAHVFEPWAPTRHADELPGLTCSRADLEVLASGAISSIFGPLFEGQDGYEVQVRMPEPPMLLADRVIGIDAEPRSMTTGTIWTETDVRGDSWYLTHEHMPAGIMIESGQADLLLISWLGIDFHNRGERSYRLLGCELMYHGGLPTVGDTLQYDIHVDGHAKHGDVRIFFFHYDCRVRGDIRLSVRQGQAGFFTDDELAASAGILWDAESGERVDDPRLDAGPCPTTKTRFTASELVAFSEGDLLTCFGTGFHRTASHTRSPRGGEGRLHMLERVDELTFNGGPWGRGYLRAVDTIRPDDWFFDGHFKNDPCMPGTLMFEGCLEAMAFYLAAMGFTIDRDGWRFEPVPEVAYKLLCRGQVVPSSRELVYEVFVEEVWDGETPTLWADLLCTVDGLKAFHCRRMGLQLTPDWPKVEERRRMAEAGTLPDLAADRVARIGDLKLDYDSILACAYGRPSEAFGEKYGVFDGGRRCPRLPGPPYLFITRITDWKGELGGMQIGTVVETEYDFTPDEWYFDENSQRTMPWCVLLEAALQPCGWLASFTGGALTAKGDVCFRNLDGRATLLREIPPGASTFSTRVVTTNVARSGSTTVFSFDVEGWLDGEKILDLSTVFGFFPPAALVHQVGLGADERTRMLRMRDDGTTIDLTSLPERWFGGSARVAPGKLRMIDRITGLWLTEGEAGEGIIRCEKTIDVRDWYFKAHFYQDAVMPGSLGIEAMLQALQCLAIAKDLDREVENPVFEILPTALETVWKYRGQVIPERERVVVVLEARQVERHEGTVTLHAHGSLWVDDLRIYEAPSIAVRIRPRGTSTGGGIRAVASATVDGADAEPEPEAASVERAHEPAVAEPSSSAPLASTSAPAPPAAWPSGTSLADAGRAGSGRLHLHDHPWLADHCPTFTIPVVPMTGILDLFAGAALRERPGSTVRGFEDVIVLRWFAVPDDGAEYTVRVEQAEDESVDLTLFGVRETATNARTIFAIARGRVLLGGPQPPPTDALPPGGLRPGADNAAPRYQDGHLFHGPSLQGMRAIVVGEAGATGWIDAARVTTPKGAVHPGLLDVLTHVIPHDGLHVWSDRVPVDRIAYPHRVPRLSFHGPMPTAGEVRVEARFRGFDGGERFPVFDVEASVDNEVFVRFRLVEALVPAGPIGAAPAADRRRFLADRAPVAGVGLASIEGSTATVRAADVRASDWLPGTLSRIYRSATGDISPRAARIAAQEWVAAELTRTGRPTHPGDVVSSPDGTLASPRALPLRAWRFDVDELEEASRVRMQGSGIDLARVRGYWRERMKLGHWPVEDLYYGLVERFVSDVVLEDPDDFASLRGQPVLFAADHQVGIESLLFSVVLSGLTSNPVLTVAKAQHRTSWMGRLIEHNFTWPGVEDPGVITFFERDDQESLLRIVSALQDDMRVRGKSVQVHVEGTRATSSRHRVTRMSAAFLEMAMEAGARVVPCRFIGGLPAEPLVERIEFPLGYAAQAIHVGRSLPPETLRSYALKERKELVMEGINALGPPHDQVPDPVPDLAFAHRVRERVARTGAEIHHAVLFEVLHEVASPCEATQRLIAADRSGRLVVGHDAADRWLAELALPLLGPRGARIETHD